MDTLSRTDGRVRSVVVAALLTAAGFLAAQLLTIPALLVDPSIATSPAAATREAVIAFFTLNFTGFFVAGGLYLAVTGRGWSYLDLRFPTRRGWLYVLAGVAGSIGFIFLVGIVTQVLDLPASQNQVVEFVGDDPTMVLILIVIVFLLNAPAEEFLFRNVVQKRLYDAFSKMGAVVVTSLIFALIHIPSFGVAADGTAAAPAELAVSLAVVFGGSVIFGYLYAKTDNLVVPIAAHAAFNAFQFGLLYIALEYGPEELETAMALLPA